MLLNTLNYFFDEILRTMFTSVILIFLTALHFVNITPLLIYPQNGIFCVLRRVLSKLREIYLVCAFLCRKAFLCHAAFILDLQLPLQVHQTWLRQLRLYLLFSHIVHALSLAASHVSKQLHL